MEFCCTHTCRGVGYLIILGKKEARFFLYLSPIAHKRSSYHRQLIVFKYQNRSWTSRFMVALRQFHIFSCTGA